MEMFHVLCVYDAINKCKIKFVCNILSSTNALCRMCCEYAENELQDRELFGLFLFSLSLV